MKKTNNTKFKSKSKKSKSKRKMDGKLVQQDE